MSKPTELSEALLHVIMARLRAGASTDEIRAEFHRDGERLRRALQERFGEEYDQLMAQRHGARGRKPASLTRGGVVPPVRGRAKGHHGAAVKPRTCLRCDVTFLSEGPHNRFCGNCGTFMAQSPSAATSYPLHLTALAQQLRGDIG